MQLSLAAWSLEDLLRWGIVFFLFVLPALKGLLDARKRAAEERSGPSPRPPRPPPEDDLDDPWKRLLRGETVARPATPPPPVVLAPPPRPRSIEHTPSPEAVATESFADELVDADLFEIEPLEELETDLASLGEVSILGERSTLEGAGLASALNAPRGALARAIDLGDPTSSAWSESASDWARAVVLSEILAQPLALRGDPGAPFAHAGR